MSNVGKIIETGLPLVLKGVDALVDLVDSESGTNYASVGNELSKEVLNLGMQAAAEGWSYELFAEKMGELSARMAAKIAQGVG